MLALRPAGGSSPLAAYAVLAGAVTYTSRQERAALLAPDPQDLLARRAALLASRAAQHQPHRADHYLRYSVLDQAIRAAHDGVLPRSDEDIVRLVLALRDHVARDACLEQASDELRDGAVQLWRFLVRATPGPDRAEPAVLLAVYECLRGDGVAAGMALEHARAADPRHRLTELITDCLACGLPPAQLQTIMHRTFVDALDTVMKSSP